MWSCERIRNAFHLRCTFSAYILSVFSVYILSTSCVCGCTHVKVSCVAGPYAGFLKGGLHFSVFGLEFHFVCMATYYC